MKNSKTVTQPKNLDQNIDSLKELLSIDPLLYDIDGQAALQLLETISQQVTTLQIDAEELQEALKASDHEGNEYSRKVDQLESEIEELEEKVEAAESTQGCLVIRMNNISLQDKLENFVKTQIYPYYNEQVANLNF